MSKQRKTAWIVMSIPGDERTETNWYVYNRDTLEQVLCESFDDASRQREELSK